MRSSCTSNCTILFSDTMIEATHTEAVAEAEAQPQGQAEEEEEAATAAATSTPRKALMMAAMAMAIPRLCLLRAANSRDDLVPHPGR